MLRAIARPGHVLSGNGQRYSMHYFLIEITSYSCIEVGQVRRLCGGVYSYSGVLTPHPQAKGPGSGVRLRSFPK